jgi:hypothetical protein
VFGSYKSLPIQKHFTEGIYEMCQLGPNGEHRRWSRRWPISVTKIIEIYSITTITETDDSDVYIQLLI